MSLQNANANANADANANANAGVSLGSLFGGTRFNSYPIGMQAFDTGAIIVPPPAGSDRSPPNGVYRGYERAGGWDAEDAAWECLHDFVESRNKGWLDQLEARARGIWKGWADRPSLNSACLEVANAAGERESRFAEIIHQHGGEGAIDYWLGMMRIDTARQPHACRLIRFARKLGEMVVMVLKKRIDAARPSQLCPAIVPMIDPPRTAAYPAGHALQAYLISYVLKSAAPHFPQSPLPDEPASIEEWRVAQHTGLFALSRRIADNRVIAGLQFEVDNFAGFILAKQLAGDLEALDSTSEFKKLLAAARAELPHFSDVVT